MPFKTMLGPDGEVLVLDQHRSAMPAELQPKNPGQGPLPHSLHRLRDDEFRRREEAEQIDRFAP